MQLLWIWREQYIANHQERTTMKLYVKNYSSYSDINERIDIKKELKEKYKLDTRRQDAFIHLALFGAQLLKEKTDIEVDDELYITSGIGNVDIVQKTNTYIYEEHQSLKLFDFINLLGNTTSYYVAHSLGIKGKNIFQISDNFTYINTLISSYASMKHSGKNAIIGAIDLRSNPSDIIKRVLSISQNLEVLSSVNYQKLSLDKKDSIAELEFDIKSFRFDEINQMISKSNYKIISSLRCDKIESKKDENFFEAMASYRLNEAIEKNVDTIYIDCYEDRYKILKIKNLR